MVRSFFLAAAVAALGLSAADGAFAQDTVKIGFILPMTGQQQSTGKQEAAAIRLYMAQHGDTVAGKKLELIIKDDSAVPDNTKRIAQELIVNDKVTFLAGFGVTPAALAVAPLSSESKTAEIVTAAGTSIITEKSPYIARTSFTLAQSTVPMADWAAQNGIKKVVTMISDYAPGVDAEKSFSAEFTKKGGQVLEAIRFPLANPDFAPFLQRAADEKPDAIFVFVPSGQGGTFVKQFVERGLDKAGIKIIGPGDVMDDDLLNGMGDAVIGTVTAHIYSADHDSAANKAFVAAFEKANGGMRPNFMAVGGYDGMHLIYEALKKTGGKTDGDSLIEAIKGMSWESPRGPISIDPQTRDIVQNVYIRKVEKKNGELYNVEFATFPAVKDPVKAAEAK
ncbi:MAG TPA: ABC transporter substrate-binding protein [Xanthobacteraceae bacterium]|nr:ABC transporter substrate-binding protein [Xanthobacteraceae bacterium]